MGDAEGLDVGGFGVGPGWSVQPDIAYLAGVVVEVLDLFGDLVAADNALDGAGDPFGGGRCFWIVGIFG